MKSTPVKILFVCYGNICRSPTAECVLRHRIGAKFKLGQVDFDSAGTSDIHAGKRSDSRTISAARTRGYEIDSIARQYLASDRDNYDFIFAMDRENLEHIERVSGKADHIRLFSSLLHDAWPSDVPDPYYGGQAGFEYVLDMVEAATDTLAVLVQERLHRMTANEVAE